ncbi:MAG TPA: hypothetical protein VMY37_22490 [Thermoguttaceae bacterium]|nr:hypothetical protein [Thermoguttaceae bacterium]
MTLDLNDPKLTAYVLGELDDADRAAVEKALESSPELRRAVEEIRRTANFLTEHLQSEPTPTLTPDQREAILQQSEEPALPTVTPTYKSWARRQLVFSLAAAVCVLLAVGVGLYSLPMIRGERSPDDGLALLTDREMSSSLTDVEERESTESYDDVDYENRFLAVDVLDPSDLDQKRAPEGSVLVEADAFHDRRTSPQPHAADSSGEGFFEISEGTISDGQSQTVGGGRVNLNTTDPATFGRVVDGGDDTVRMNLAKRQALLPARIEVLPGTDVLVIRGHERDVQKVVEQIEELSDELPVLYPNTEVWQRLTERRQTTGQPSNTVALQAPGVFSADLDIPGADIGEKPGQAGDRLADTRRDRSAGAEQGGGQRSESRAGDGKPGKQQKKPAQATTWRRAKATPNASRLMVGDQKDLPLEGMQANVTIDGFRARVLLDYYFYNDGDRQYEGTFKLRLPNDASLYFFAFGESAYRYRPQEKKDVRGAFLTVSHTDPAGGLPDEIVKLRADSWNTPKVARVVPREKAAFAYRQTVRRRVDPALVEWSGAGVFSARVFPLAPQKLHRIVVGYDVDLAPVEGVLEYRLDLPEVAECEVDLSVTTWSAGKARVTPDVKPFLSNHRACYHFADPENRQVRVRLENPGTVLLTGADAKTGDYFATRFRPELSDDENGTSASTAVFLLDTSLSANPDKFNVWLKLLRAVLEENRDSLERFAVLTFNVEAHWWREAWAENTPENVEKLIDYANTLSLEGATNLEQALREAASPSWPTGQEEIGPWDVFLLSDGAPNWGGTNVHVLAEMLADDSSHAGALFAYQTGLAGTETRLLDHLARHTGGAVFAVLGEAEVARVARAHRKRPWQLVDVASEGASDLLLAGRPKTIFPGQELLLVGRGKPAQDARIVLKLRRGGQKKTKTVRIQPDRVIQSELAPRVYGQVAVGQLESLDEAAEDVAASYARHFRVTGQTCSLLMLESEADYQRFEIGPEDDALVVNSSSADQVISTVLAEAIGRLLDPKAAFQAWLGRMEKVPGAQFRVSPALKLAVESLPREAFEVRTKPLRCKHRTWDGIPSELKESLSVAQVDYDAIAAEADRRMQAHGEADALLAFSSLVEHSPGDLALVRDVAYTALAWGLPDQAYPLLRRVAMARPYEPQMYLAMAQSLADSGHPDLAMFYYEVALGGAWDNRFRDFRRIASVDYLHLLRKIAEGTEKTHLEQFASARLDSLEAELKLKAADLVVTMQWNTDATDVDLHVGEPNGEVCYYENRSTKIGGQLTPDCTQGFGPEMYVLQKAPDGKYQVQVKYYSSDQNRAGTRTKVYATIYEGWGGRQERVLRKTVVLSQGKEMHDVATIGLED